MATFFKNSLFLSIFISFSVFAQTKTYSETELVAESELALVQVFKEICPALLPKNKQANFQRNHAIIVLQLLPDISNPENALAALATDKKFQASVARSKKETLAFSEVQNKQVCLDIANMTN